MLLDSENGWVPGSASRTRPSAVIIPRARPTDQHTVTGAGPAPVADHASLLKGQRHWVKPVPSSRLAGGSVGKVTNHHCD